MGKKKAADKVAKKIAKLEAFIADKSNPKPERKAAKAKLVELTASTLRPVPDAKAAAGILSEAESSETLNAQGVEPPTPEEINAAADAVLADPNASPGAREKAEKAKARAAQIAAAKAAAAEPAAEDPAPEPVDDAAVSARIQAKRALRKAGLLAEGDKGEAMVDPDAVPRDRADLVDAYNLIVGTVTGHYLTSDAERERIAERIAKPTAGRDPEPSPAVAQPDEIDAPEPEPQRETEAPAEPAFVAPSDAVPTTFEANGRGQYIVKRPEDGKLVGYTRTTTYIDNLEDKTALTDWKLRILLEGLARNEVEVGTTDDEAVSPHLLGLLREAIHKRDHAIAKARKADRKGKLAKGELGALIDEANRAYKKTANAIAQDALDFGGVKDAATKGTDLHELVELYDAEGMAAIEAKLEAGEITRADFDDVEAYAVAMKRAGVEVIANEVHVVNHELKVAGRLDKIVMAKSSPTAQRRTKMIADVKTGRVDFAPGKIAQQLEMYASSEAYDVATHESTPLGVSSTVALLIHLPAGKAECRVHPVDLSTGRRGNRLSGEVRRWRNESRRLSIDFGTDLAGGEA